MLNTPVQLIVLDLFIIKHSSHIIDWPIGKTDSLKYLTPLRVCFLFQNSGELGQKYRPVSDPVFIT